MDEQIQGNAAGQAASGQADTNTADLLKLADGVKLGDETDPAAGKSQTQAEIDFKNAELARKFYDPDDPDANLYNRKREYQRKAEKLNEEVTKLRKELADLKKNGDVNSTLERILSIQSNPEIIEFEKMTDEKYADLIENDAEKAKRYVKYLVEQNLKVKEKQEAVAQKQPDEKKPDTETETLQKENMLKALNQGVLSIKEKYGVDITPDNLQKLLNTTDFSDLYSLSLLKQNQFDKVLSNDQMLMITRSTLKKIKEQQMQQPPHSLTQSGGSATIEDDKTKDVQSYSELAKTFIKNSGLKS